MNKMLRNAISIVLLVMARFHVAKRRECVPLAVVHQEIRIAKTDGQRMNVKSGVIKW